ncbi:MAG: non-canonical purine NTP pyrophosphatase [Treponema sp.]|jgi:XTP/dITP diphosphohydrolase|nr:non-canonical purine NTP pyrophosphatase [Treponema sp.]
MVIYLASGNRHKKRELQAAFLGYELKTPLEAGIASFEADECGVTFMENSLIKARALRLLLNKAGLEGPVLADDSGLCVDALGGRPGIYSARYRGKTGNTGPAISAGEQNALLLDEVNALAGAKGRSCRFVCAMTLLWEAERFCTAQETLEGELVITMDAAQGSLGFGYDPVVFLPERGCTVAELSEDEKNRISHRGKAARLIYSCLTR